MPILQATAQPIVAPAGSDRVAIVRRQLERQVSHWEAASLALSNPSSFATPQAWQALERYLDRAVRESLEASTTRLRREVEGLATQLRASNDLAQLRVVERRLQGLRRLYEQVEAVVSFYSDAVNTRSNPTLATHLRALDRLAEASISAALLPLGRPVPPVLTYVDKGLGAAILKAGVRLWDGALSPAAAIKITRHNLYRPTSLIHETGHQVAHATGWNNECARTLAHCLSREAAVAATWTSWTSEITADVFAFVHCGYASVAALHDVVANEIESVLRFIPGDPHPISYLRVLLGVACCRQIFGRGVWDDLEAAWILTHPLSQARPGVRALIELSVKSVPAIAATLLTSRLESLGGRSITALIDPERVSPAQLERLARDAGPALLTSSHWATREGLRIVALLGMRMATDPHGTARHVKDVITFTTTLGNATTSATTF